MKSVWDFWARFYDHLWVQKVSLRPTRKLVNEQLCSLARQRGKLAILDVGCGTGQQYGELMGVLGTDGFDYVGFDISAAMIHQARGKFPTGDFRVCDVAGFKSKGLWDAIICSSGSG